MGSDLAENSVTLIFRHNVRLLWTRKNFHISIDFSNLKIFIDNADF